jgi:hypothetical protein
MQTTVEIGLALAALYLLIGVPIAVGLQLVGLKKIDPAVVGAGWCFRLLITPGLIALWPLLLQRWRLASAGPQPGGVQRPLSAAGLRALHRRLALTLALVVPVLAIAGLLLRPGQLPADAQAAVLMDGSALPQLLAEAERPFGELPIRLSLRAGDGDQRQVELEIDRDLELPNLLIYWIPEAGSFPEGSIYLGAVWGPGTRRYTIDRELLDRGGDLLLYSLTHQTRVAAAAVPRS